jgi:hypothetical protein
MAKIKVTIWNEGRHEKRNPKVQEIYPDGIHNCVKRFLEVNEDMEVRAVTLDGKEVWQFQSQMSDESQWQGQWWAKCSIPGVRGITVARLAGGKTYLVIGDSLSSDIDGAIASGLDCVWFSPKTKFSSKAADAKGRKPTYTVQKLPELLSIL